MLSRKSLAIASLCTIVCAQGSFAEEAFKSSQLLAYSSESQRGFISTSIIMASLIASQNSRKQANCINDWSGKTATGGYQPVVEAMKRFPDHHPSGVVLAVIQKVCGALKYSTP